jgi:pilus assembly protein Flp/PilA
MKKITNNQKGQSLVEYLILVALVAVSSIAIVRSVGQNIQAKFADVAHSMGATVEGNREAAPVSSEQYRKKDFRDFLSGSLSRSESQAR